MKTPEGYVKDDVRKWLKSIGVYFFSNTTFGYGGSGQPDICGCYYSVFFGMEIKAEGKTPTPKQFQRMEQIHKAGGVAFWGDSLQSIQDQFKQHFGV